jgi:hypothetical protein
MAARKLSLSPASRDIRGNDNEACHGGYAGNSGGHVIKENKKCESPLTFG